MSKFVSKKTRFHDFLLAYYSSFCLCGGWAAAYIESSGKTERSLV